MGTLNTFVQAVLGLMTFLLAVVATPCRKLYEARALSSRAALLSRARLGDELVERLVHRRAGRHEHGLATGCRKRTHVAHVAHTKKSK